MYLREISLHNILIKLRKCFIPIWIKPEQYIFTIKYFSQNTNNTVATKPEQYLQ